MVQGISSDIDPKLLQVTGHFAPDFRQLGFDLDDLLLESGHVDLFLGLERIDVAGDVEVEVVLFNLLRCCAV